MNNGITTHITIKTAELYFSNCKRSSTAILRNSTTTLLYI